MAGFDSLFAGFGSFGVEGRAGSMVPADFLPARRPVPDWSGRLDPVFDGTAPAQASFVSFLSFPHLLRLGAAGAGVSRLKFFRPDPARRSDPWMVGLLSDSRCLRVASVVSMYRNVSTAVLRGFVGFKPDRFLEALWLAGLVEVAATPWGLGFSASMPAWVWRVRKAGPWGRFVAGFLQPEVWRAFPAGRLFAPSMGARQDIVTGELLLRLAGLGCVGGVLGEASCSMSNLFGVGAGRGGADSGIGVWARRGDGMFTVRGVRVVLEVETSRATVQLRDKVLRYMDMLRVAGAGAGVVVLFVSVPDLRPDFKGRGDVGGTVRRVLREFSGSELSSLFGVVDWSDWFAPDPSGSGAVGSEKFNRLEVERVTDGVWGPVWGLVSRRHDLRGLERRLSGLLSTPHWLFDSGPVPGLAEALLESRGLDRPVGFRPAGYPYG